MSKNVIQEEVSEKLEAIMSPGVIAEMEPDEAEIAGAFSEDALSLAEALDASLDMGG